MPSIIPFVFLVLYYIANIYISVNKSVVNLLLVNKEQFLTFLNSKDFKICPNFFLEIILTFFFLFQKIKTIHLNYFHSCEDESLQ